MRVTIRRTTVLAGIDEQVFIDIDSLLLLRPVYGPAKQGASFGRSNDAPLPAIRGVAWAASS